MFNPNMRPTPSSPFNARVRSEKRTQSALRKENVEQVSRKPTKTFSPCTPKYTGTPTRQPRGMRFDYASDPLGFFPTRTTPPKGPVVEQGASDSPLKPGTSGSPLKRGFQYLCDNFIPSFGMNVACDNCTTESPSGPSRKPKRTRFAPEAFPGKATDESNAESSSSRRDAPRTDACPPSPSPPPAPRARARARTPPAPAPAPIRATTPPRCASPKPPRRISIPDRMANARRFDSAGQVEEVCEGFGLGARAGPQPQEEGPSPRRGFDGRRFERLMRECEEERWRRREEAWIQREMQEAREREATEAKRKERARKSERRRESSKRSQERDQKPRVYEEFPEISRRTGESSARQRSKQEERRQQAEASSSRAKPQKSSGARFHPYAPPNSSKRTSPKSDTPGTPGPSRPKASATKPVSVPPAPEPTSKRTTVASSPGLDLKKFSKDASNYLEWYDHSWTTINSSGDSSALSFSDIPWAILPFPRSPNEVTATAVRAFLNQRCLLASKTSSSSSPAQPNAANRKRSLKRELLNWHPDKLSNRVLLRVSDAREQEVIKDAADVVQKTLTAYINEPEGAAGRIKGTNR